MDKLQYAWRILTTRSAVDLGGANSLFGSIARNNIPIPVTKDFIPNGFNGEVVEIGSGDNHPARWLGLSTPSMQYQAYGYCSPLAAVIDRLAEADTNGRLQILGADEIPLAPSFINKSPRLSRVMKLLKNPNPFQTWEEFNSEQVVLCKIFGYAPMFAIGPVGMDKSYSSALINLNPYYFRPQRNDEFDPMKPKSGSPILEWVGHFFGKELRIKSSDVLVIKDGFIHKTSDNLGLPISKVEGLDYFISNICAAMEADNVLLKKKGPLGIFSHDPKPDIAGWQPLKKEEKSEIQEDLQRYGLTFGQLQYIVSKTPLKWNAMSFNLRDLMTKETVRQGIDGICDRLGYPAELMSGKNATYENRKSAEQYMYQSNIIPFSLRRMAKYDQFFGLEDNILYLDYDHLPVMQEDIEKSAEARKNKSLGLQTEWKEGMITWNQWQKEMNRPTVDGMDIYYPEWLKLNPIENEIAPKNTGAQK